MNKKLKSGPPQHYPELGGAMERVTVLLPPAVIEWARKHPSGMGHAIRDAVVARFRRAK